MPDTKLVTGELPDVYVDRGDLVEENGKILVDSLGALSFLLPSKSNLATSADSGTPWGETGGGGKLKL